MASGAPHCSDKKRPKNENLKRWVSCASVFRSLPEDDENAVCMRHSKELVEAFKKTPPNGGSRRDSGRMLACHEGHDGHRDVYGRIDPRQSGPTMTTAKGRFVHPTQHHGITVRQAARIQTFPDEFVFKGGLMAAGVQIGNAVPVQFGEILIRSLTPFLWRARRVRLGGDSDESARCGDYFHRPADEIETNASERGP